MPSLSNNLAFAPVSMSSVRVSSASHDVTKDSRSLLLALAVLGSALPSSRVDIMEIC
jgi:hypothetical protein